jgi:hypothetical protein
MDGTENHKIAFDFMGPICIAFVIEWLLYREVVYPPEDVDRLRSIALIVNCTFACKVG